MRPRLGKRPRVGMRPRAWSGGTICLVEVQQSVVWLTADATSVTTSAGWPGVLMREAVCAIFVEQYCTEPLFCREPQETVALAQWMDTATDSATEGRSSSSTSVLQRLGVRPAGCHYDCKVKCAGNRNAGIIKCIIAKQLLLLRGVWIDRKEQ